MSQIRNQRGFTLLELLVVIVVIGILALLVIPNLTSAPKKARDVQRKTDLKAVQKGLEEYYVNNSAYPVATTYCALSGGATTTATTCSTGTSGALTSGSPAIMKTIPTDPLYTGNYVYSYTGTATTYTLKGCLENLNEAISTTVLSDATACGTGGKAFTLTNLN